MAENDTPQSDRTEKPTPKRLEDARRQGRIPRSRELSMTLVMLVSAGVFVVASGHFGAGLDRIVATGLELPDAALLEPNALPGVLGESIADALALIAPLLGAVVVAALAGALAFGGWTLNFESLAPKLERLNPLTGMKRVVGWAGIAELGKALAKFVLVA